ncbi:MAG: hypothetical protein JRJ68_03895 [Deltaproteobacteria bacterium]|nr:hypothetical protein [Deltaproteobacteria bacterium]
MKWPGNYISAVLLYSVMLATLYFPFWGLGEVVCPHRQAAELAAVDYPDVTHIENRFFSDFYRGFLPVITGHYDESRSGALALWTKKNAIGKPLRQVFGFSPSWLPSFLLFKITSSPFIFITILSLSSVYLMGLFIILLCREINLSPLAGLVGGTILATSPIVSFWLTFPMMLSTWCWSAGVLYSIARLSRRIDWWGWLIAAFSIYSLLLSGYPQAVIFHFYIFIVFGSWEFSKSILIDKQKGLWRVLFFVSGCLVGATLSFPIYADLITTTLNSQRISPDNSYFTGVLPFIQNITDAKRYALSFFYPEIFGNPIKSSYPLQYKGISITPLILFFVCASFLFNVKRTFPWWVLLLLFCVLSLSESAYTWALDHMLFNISRHNPMRAIYIPVCILSAYGVEACLQKERGWLRGLISFICLLSLLFLVSAWGVKSQLQIDWFMVLFFCLISVCLLGTLMTSRAILVALILSLALLTYPKFLRQERSHIAMTSPSIHLLKENVAQGSVFAVVDQKLRLLPPNYNANLGISSFHSYDSLSSREYQTLVAALGGKMSTNGRLNHFILPDYDDVMFWMSNISLLLTREKIQNPYLLYVGTEANVRFYRSLSRMGECIQVPVDSPDLVVNGSWQLKKPLNIAVLPEKIIDRGDIVTFSSVTDKESVMILSQVYHRDWDATILRDGKWWPAKTIVVNKVFQGVLLPENTEQVTLTFNPFARYALFCHVIWLGLLLFLLVIAGARWFGKAGERGE